jgi:hypothetical protein
VTVQGLLVHMEEDDVWLLSLPTPFAHRNRMIGEVELAGNRSRWAGFRGHYVEARGRLVAWAGGMNRGALQVESVRGTEPTGLVRRTIGDSAAPAATIMLWVLPLRFAWMDRNGYPTGVGPVLVYTMERHGTSDLVLSFPTTGFVCFAVEPLSGRGTPWTYKVFLDPLADQANVTVPRLVREVARLSRDGAPTAGKYRVRASLCGLTDYEVETELEVLR